MIVIVCGVAGTGKSTIGALLANELNIRFYDGDDFHPDANKEKMNRGIPLDDNDRQPWLDTLAGHLVTWSKQGGAVLGCSALKESYREILASKCNEHIHWVILHGSKQLLTERLNKREGHFFNPDLLRSQLGTFQTPNYGWAFDVHAAPKDIVGSILEQLNLN